MVSTAESTAGELDNNIVTATPVNRKEVDDVAIQETVEEVAKAASHRQDVIRVAHIMSHEIGHGEPVNILFVVLSLCHFLSISDQICYSDFLCSSRGLRPQGRKERLFHFGVCWNGTDGGHCSRCCCGKTSICTISTKSR